MEPFEWPGFVIATLIFLILGFFVSQRHLSASLSPLIAQSLAARILGVLIYAFVVFSIYGGAADPVLYYRWGTRFAAYFSTFDFSPFTDPRLWRTGDFIGTNFVGYPAAILVLIVGESFRGTWLIFSVLCLSGLMFFVKVFGRAYGPVDYKKFASLLLLYPSLWFWTASISKDGWMIFGVGLFMLGMVDKQKKQNILLMALGLIWCSAVRPQIAAILAFAAAGAYFALSLKKLNFQNIAVIVIATIGAFYLLSVLGIGTGVSDIENFAEGQRGRSEYGGSVIQLATGPQAYVLGVVNILLRPFPWEATGFLQIISFLDIYFIWYLVVTNWQSVLRALRRIRTDRLIAFSLIFIILYSVGAGLTLSNLGLIARQRIILYPFMFLIIYAYSDESQAYRRSKYRRYIRSKIQTKRIQNA